MPNNTLLAKIAGWLQFALAAIGTAATTGLPHGALGWLGLLGSLATAIGVHNASNSPGVKPTA
jgi:hypothetical protein